MQLLFFSFQSVRDSWCLNRVEESPSDSVGGPRHRTTFRRYGVLVRWPEWMLFVSTPSLSRLSHPRPSFVTDQPLPTFATGPPLLPSGPSARTLRLVASCVPVAPQPLSPAFSRRPRFHHSSLLLGTPFSCAHIHPKPRVGLEFRVGWISGSRRHFTRASGARRVSN